MMMMRFLESRDKQRRGDWEEHKTGEGGVRLSEVKSKDGGWWKAFF